MFMFIKNNKYFLSSQNKRDPFAVKQIRNTGFNKESKDINEDYLHTLTSRLLFLVTNICQKYMMIFSRIELLQGCSIKK